MATEIQIMRQVVVTTTEEVEAHIRTKGKPFQVEVRFLAQSEDESGNVVACEETLTRRFFAVDEAKFHARGYKSAPGVLVVDVTNCETGRTLSF